MKLLKTLFAIVIVSCLFASTVNAQAVVEKDNTWWLYGTYTSVDHHQVITPDGSVYFRVSFEVPLTDPLIVAAIAGGKYTVETNVWLNDGVNWYLVPVIITFYPNGKVKARGHLEVLE